jgi:serine/threonine protein kinase
MASLVGKTLKNRYRVDEFIGRGGMADVYKVFDLERGVPLAMKVLRDDLAEDRVFLRRFEREAQNLSKLQHPNIVRFYGLEQEGHLAFILMDFIEGPTLRRMIFDAHKPFTDQQVLEIMQPICSSLYYAHQQGIVHCDIKSANIMLDKGNRVYLTDFGIARMADAATSTMVGIGTPAYMAPELIMGKDPTPQTDIYALGILLYEMYSGGERPFTGENAQTTGTTAEKVRWEQLHKEAPSLSQYNHDISENLEKVVQKCLNKDPKDRYAGVNELINALYQQSSKEISEAPKLTPIQENQVNLKIDEKDESSKVNPEPKHSYKIVYLLGTLIICGVLFFNSNAGKNAMRFLAQSTATATRVPTVTPKPKTPTPVCNLASPYKTNWKTLLCESFSNDNGNFYTGSDSDELIKGSAKIINGKYVWDISGKATSGYRGGVVQWTDIGSASDFVLSIDGKIDSVYKECGWGVAFRGKGNSFYLFQLQHNGYYSFDLLSNGDWTSLIPWRANNAIKWDENNNVTIVAEGSNFKFYVNGTLVNSYDSDYLNGTTLYLVVTAAEGASANIEFDNLLVRGS